MFSKIDGLNTGMNVQKQAGEENKSVIHYSAIGESRKVARIRLEYMYRKC